MGTSAKFAGYRPRALRVRDARLADMLPDALAGLAIQVDVVDELPAVRAVVHAMAGALSETPVSAALDAPGVTPARLAAFADAAKRFFDAAPWRHLDDGDLIKVEKPKAGRGLSLFGVMGRRRRAPWNGCAQRHGRVVSRPLRSPSAAWGECSRQGSQNPIQLSIEPAETAVHFGPELLEGELRVLALFDERLAHFTKPPVGGLGQCGDFLSDCLERLRHRFLVGHSTSAVHSTCHEIAGSCVTFFRLKAEATRLGDVLPP
jgi:hypothetical protein